MGGKTKFWHPLALSGEARGKITHSHSSFSALLSIHLQSSPPNCRQWEVPHCPFSIANWEDYEFFRCFHPSYSQPRPIHVPSCMRNLFPAAALCPPTQTPLAKGDPQLLLFPSFTLVIPGFFSLLSLVWLKVSSLSVPLWDGRQAGDPPAATRHLSSPSALDPGEEQGPAPYCCRYRNPQDNCAPQAPPNFSQRSPQHHQHVPTARCQPSPSCAFGSGCPVHAFYRKREQCMQKAKTPGALL